MPIYEYKIKSGPNKDKTVEVIQKITDEPLEIHPDTGEEVERIISKSSFELKGTGWYKTDYKYK